MSFLALLEVLNFDFSFSHYSGSKFTKIQKLRVSEIVKMAILEIQNLPKLISRKIEWHKSILELLALTSHFHSSRSIVQGNFPKERSKFYREGGAYQIKYLLKIFVKFKAMIAAICYDNMTVMS